ncbi:MAG: STAS domain-containing protein [Pirellulales bacterium]|nr:STAS domain-containing protein [Pirellulales bacterium]
MVQTDISWRYDVDRGPDWVFVRLHPNDGGSSDLDTLAERLWSVLEQNFVYRLVLELDEVPVIQSYLIAQLVLLGKRIHSHGGLLRLCGLSTANQEVIRLCRLDGCLPYFGNRGDAVMGHRPMQPR